MELTKEYFEERLTQLESSLESKLDSKLNKLESKIDEKLSGQTKELKKFAIEQTEDLARMTKAGFGNVDKQFAELRAELKGSQQKGMTLRVN